MENLKEYISSVIGYDISINQPSVELINNLPLYIRHIYKFKYISLQNHQLFLMEVKDEQIFNFQQIDNQIGIVKGVFNEKIIVLLFHSLSAIRRKKLIERKINFIVPGKQLYIPQIFIDLRESFQSSNTEKGKLIPSAQLILLFKLLNRDNKFDHYNFKQLSDLFQYSTMAITKAAYNLKELGLCKIYGSREKYITFDDSSTTLWDKASPFLINPIFKKVFVDNKPESGSFLFSNESAIGHYTNMAESRQIYLAVDRNIFYGILKQKGFENLNDREGNYCLEVWRYNPLLLTNDNYIDPLSLYLSLRDIQDERIEMSLDSIKRQYLW